MNHPQPKPERRVSPWGWAFILLVTLAVPTALMAQDSRDDEFAQLHKKAADIRSSVDKLSKFRAIPWVTDVFEGFRLAKEEHRPVFLYTIVGDPLEDC